MATCDFGQCGAPATKSLVSRNKVGRISEVRPMCGACASLALATYGRSLHFVTEIEFRLLDRTDASTGRVSFWRRLIKFTKGGAHGAASNARTSVR
jgi:hypothetical protein